jgi:hypothetical protein
MWWHRGSSCGLRHHKWRNRPDVVAQNRPGTEGKQDGWGKTGGQDGGARRVGEIGEGGSAGASRTGTSEQAAVAYRGLVSSVMPYLPFMDGPADAGFRWRLGVRPLDLDDWFECGPDADAALARKGALNQQHPDTVFAVLDDVESEASEVAVAISAHIDAPLRPDLHPLDAAARLVAEDLVMMVERPGPDGLRLVFGGGSVCFPNRWDLRSKLGLTMAEVHAPVAQLNDQLSRPIDGFLDRLRPDRSFWRLGWGILDTDDWYTPIDGTAASLAHRTRPRCDVASCGARDAAPVPGDQCRALHDPHLRSATGSGGDDGGTSGALGDPTGIDAR